MNNLSILRHALKLNADVITMTHCAVAEFKLEAAAWKAQGETAYFEAACDDARKHKRKLARSVEQQRRIKLEIVTYFRNERIKRKYLKVFGKLPEQALYTSHEQEVMLDRLLSEQQAEASLAIAE